MTIKTVTLALLSSVMVATAFGWADAAAIPAKCHLLSLPKGALKKGKSYMVARRQILAAGYLPAAALDSVYCKSPALPEEVSTCRILPELDDCGGDTSNCDMWFRDKAGNRLRVVMNYGWVPTDGEVYYWELHCAKNNQEK
jgi:hypothetical protein